MYKYSVFVMSFCMERLITPALEPSGEYPVQNLMKSLQIKRTAGAIQ